MDVNATYNKRDWVRAYLDIWRGIMELTEKETELTTLIALRYLDLEKQVASPSLLAELLLSPNAKLQLRKQMVGEEEAPMSANNLQNYLTSLKDKGVLIPQDDKFLLAPLLVPDTTLTFTFLVQD